MSVTVLQSPDELMPVYNDIVFTVNSTNKANCSFRYICDIYIDSIFRVRLKLFPDPITGCASFKVNRVLEDYISYDLHNNLYGTNIFSQNANTCKSYYLRFGEEYDASAQCDVGTTIYDNLTTTSDFFAFNAALQYKEWLSWDSTDYSMVGSSKKFLTNMPDRALISNGSQLTFNFLNSGSVDKLQVVTYDYQGNVLGTYKYTNAFSSVIGDATKILTVGVGPENLNNSTLSSGSQPVIGVNVAYYTIQLLHSTSTLVSEAKRIDIDKRKTKFNTHRLWWLNRLGGFDSYDFNLKDKRKVDTSRTFFNKIYGEYRTGSPSNKWTYDIGNRGKTGLSINAQQGNVFNSNWLTEKESIWMEELFTTLEIYLSDTNKISKFCSVTYSKFVDDYTLTIEVQDEYEYGDSIYIDFGSSTLFTSGLYTVESYSNGSVTINIGSTCISTGFPPACIDLDDYAVEGFAYRPAFNSELDPIIIKSSTYDEKIKYRVKNIDYQLEIEPAYAINTQRN